MVSFQKAKSSTSATQVLQSQKDQEATAQPINEGHDFSGPSNKLGFPGGSVVKNLTLGVGDVGVQERVQERQETWV